VIARAAAADVAPTPKDPILEDGPATLYRFRRPTSDRFRGPGSAEAALPLLIVPSLINRWYVVDLRPGASLAAGLVDAGLDTWCLDWGIPRDEDRHLTWDEVLDRLSRMARRVRRETGASRIGVLGYCMGGTLSAIHTALQPETVAALVNLAGPIRFDEGGTLRHMVDRRWFDADAVADAGNVRPEQMQAGFVMLRPTAQLGKWVTLLDRAHDPEARAAFGALEAWAEDNIPFPAEAYRRYIRDLYQDDQLVRGEHRIRGARVDLSRIRCPLLTVAAERDTICPPAAATALDGLVGSDDTERLLVPGGHVGMVVGRRAKDRLYPQMAAWLRARLGSTTNAATPPS
jgi:polyhydroxyalkanoate synthase